MLPFWSCLASLFVAARAYDASVINVNDFGAIPTINTVEVALNNSAAFGRAFQALQSSEQFTTLLFPAGFTYYMYPIPTVTALQNKTITIDSMLYACNDIDSWPNDNHSYFNLFEFHNASRVTFQGNGRIDGQGYKWWALFAVNDIPLERPHLFETTYSTNITVKDLHFTNSPRYHLHLILSTDLLVQNVTVFANTTQQQQLWIQHGLWDYDENVPIFPFNTDGIDVSGQNIVVRNCTIHNYDDSVCIKPTQLKTWGCTQNVLVEHCVQVGGAGMSVGSVPPNDNTNCIQNVVFRDIVFQSPLKAIYIKTNSGDHGDGRIYNITYENIVMYQDAELFPEHAFLWPIYIGPQQQKEPDGGGDGCFIDFVRCPTQPRVNLTNVYLNNVTAVQSIFTNPAVLNCNWTNPCTEFVFNDVNFVNVSYAPWDELYVCKNVIGEFNRCEPKPVCFENVTDSEK